MESIITGGIIPVLEGRDRYENVWLPKNMCLEK